MLQFSTWTYVNTVCVFVWFAFEFSDHDGCGGGWDRNYSEHKRGEGSYRDPYVNYGKSPVLTCLS